MINKSRQGPKKRGLYKPANEHDACGVGFVVTLDGGKSYRIIECGIQVILNLVHRGAVGGDLSLHVLRNMVPQRSTSYRHKHHRPLCPDQQSGQLPEQ